MIEFFLKNTPSSKYSVNLIFIKQAATEKKRKKMGKQSKISIFFYFCVYKF